MAAQKVISSSGGESSGADKLRQKMIPKRSAGVSPRVVACADGKAEGKRCRLVSVLDCSYLLLNVIRLHCQRSLSSRKSNSRYRRVCMERATLWHSSTERMHSLDNLKRPAFCTTSRMLYLGARRAFTNGRKSKIASAFCGGFIMVEIGILCKEL